MVTVTISEKTRQFLLDQTLTGRLLGGRQRADGMWDVDVDEDVAQKLEAVDADIDRAIEMIATKQFGHS